MSAKVEFHEEDSAMNTIKKSFLYLYIETSIVLRNHGHTIILTMAVINYLMNFIICFSPTLQRYINDDYDLAAAQTSNFLFVVGSTSLLMISILPGIDLILDFLAPFTSSSYSKHFRKAEAAETRDYNHLANKTTRLTLTERAMFFVGVAGSAIAIFPAYQNSAPHTQIVLYAGFENNSIFVLAPILSFLTRSSTTWVPSLTILITLLACGANFTVTIAYAYPYESAYFNDLVYAGALMTVIATALYGAGLAASAFNTYLWHLSKDAKIHNTQDSLGAMDLLNEETIHHMTVGAQSTVTAIDFATNLYWYYIGNNGNSFDLSTTGIFMLVMAGSNILTYLIEFRVRKSEVSTALYALLDSKKAYVRYISHELRTPMNVALLGVNLSRNDVKENADPEWGDGVVDTLEDVELACSSAVNILNDLLSFEKMESGILELHTEPLVVLSFINDCVRIFSLQAREKGVILKVDLSLTDEDIEAGLYPVLPSDVVMGDRFKLEQVLRNLVSNALKFSPAGSTVALGALYRPPSLTKQSTNSYKSSRSQSSGGKVSGKAALGESTPKVSSRIAQALQSFGTFSSSKPSESSVKKTNDMTSSRKGMYVAAVGGLLIRCVDQGAGISVENQAKLFRGVVQFNPEKLQAVDRASACSSVRVSWSYTRA